MNINRYCYILAVDSKHKYLSLGVIILLIILLFFTSLMHTYDSFVVTSLYSDGFLKVNVPVLNSDSVLYGDYLTFNGSKYEYEVIDISPVFVENDIFFQSFSLKINDSFKDNEYMKITFYFKSQRVIEKIINIIV